MRFHRAGTGQGPYDVVLSAVLDAAQEKQGAPAGSELPSSAGRPRLSPCRPGPALCFSYMRQAGVRGQRAEGRGLRGTPVRSSPRRQRPPTRRAPGQATQSADPPPPLHFLSSYLLVLPTSTRHPHHAPSPCTLTMHPHHAPTSRTLIKHPHHAPSPRTLTTHPHHAPSPRTLTTYRHHAPSPHTLTAHPHHAP